jgi:hypothetical protein
MNRYTLRKDPKYDTLWIALPNNGGEVGDLSDITCELNRLLGNYEVAIDERDTAIAERDEARQQRDNLQNWKNDQMTVNSEWDMQTVGKLLGVRIGEAITLNIEPKIRELINQRDSLAKALEECKEDSIELLGERDWWQNEPRCGYMKDYKEIQNNIARADEILAIVKGVSND